MVFVCVDDNEDDFLAEVYHGAFFWDLGTCGHMLRGKILWSQGFCRKGLAD